MFVVSPWTTQTLARSNSWFCNWRVVIEWVACALWGSASGTDFSEQRQQDQAPKGGGNAVWHLLKRRRCLALTARVILERCLEQLVTVALMPQFSS